MKKKLTLSIDTEVLQKARLFTKNRKQSLSFVVEEFFKTVLKNETTAKKKEMTFTETFRKKFPPPEIKLSDKKMEKGRHKYIIKKYG